MRVTTSCSSCVHTQLLFKYDHTLARYRSQPSSPYIYARDELLDGHFPIVVPCFFSATEALCQRFFYRTYHFNANNIQKNPFTNINYVSKRTTYRGTTFFGSFLPSSPTSQKKERLAFVLTVEQFRICLLIDKLFSKAIFSFSYLTLLTSQSLSAKFPNLLSFSTKSIFCCWD